MSIIKIATTLVILFMLSLFIVSCGGGGSGNTSNSGGIPNADPNVRDPNVLTDPELTRQITALQSRIAQLEGSSELPVDDLISAEIKQELTDIGITIDPVINFTGSIYTMPVGEFSKQGRMNLATYDWVTSPNRPNVNGLKVDANLTLTVNWASSQVTFEGVSYQLTRYFSNDQVPELEETNLLQYSASSLQLDPNTGHIWGNINSYINELQSTDIYQVVGNFIGDWDSAKGIVSYTPEDHTKWFGTFDVE